MEKKILREILDMQHHIYRNQEEEEKNIFIYFNHLQPPPLVGIEI